jgi:hypothetical protein
MRNSIHRESFSTVLCAIVFIMAALCSVSLAEETAVLRAGAFASDITPKEFPLNMPGGFNANMAESAHDPLHSRALVLDDGSSMIAMVLVDNLGVAPDVIEESKAIASKETGIPTDRIMVCSTHTHSAPSSGSNAKDGPAIAYRKLLVAGIADSIIKAQELLQPASIGFDAHPLAEEVFNRRWFLKPLKMPLNPFGEMDQVKMNPGTSAEVLDRPAGPTDPDITVISVLNAKRKPLALLANYSLHYVGAIPRQQVSADYFGEFSRLMPTRMRADENFVAMMSNGASGDINNIPFLVNRAPRERFEQVRIVASKAADTAWTAQRKIEEHRSDARLGMLQREITLNYRRPTDKQLAEARRIAALPDQEDIKKLPRLAQAYARRTINAGERKEDSVTVKLQAIRIGDLSVCCIPFETLVEIGLELKDRSPFERTMVIGLANGRYGYLPTPRQHRLGGYETWLGTNHVQKDASDILIASLMEMLTELKAGK